MLGLVSYESRDGFARVLARRPPPGLWVRVKDIPGGELHPWVDLLTEHAHNYRGYEGQIMHDAPSADSPVLVTLHDSRLQNSRVHRLVPTGPGPGVGRSSR